MLSPKGTRPEVSGATTSEWSEWKGFLIDPQSVLDSKIARFQRMSPRTGGQNRSFLAAGPPSPLRKRKLKEHHKGEPDNLSDPPLWEPPG